MLRHETVMSILRFYKEEVPSNYADYCAVCNVVWETEEVIWLKGFHGEMQRKHFRHLLKWLIDNKIKSVKAYRSPKHILPLAVDHPGGYFEIRVQDLIDRFVKEADGER